ncbi:hypothetical protein RSAG8_13698, partial [Rhizoctonia solani AG-8 WAC10335]
MSYQPITTTANCLCSPLLVCYAHPISFHTTPPLHLINPAAYEPDWPRAWPGLNK